MDKSVTIIGAGVLGLWQAIELADTGFRVRVIERSPQPFETASSRLAGAMLAPDCEAEAAPAIIRDLGREATEIWAKHYPLLQRKGTLVVALPRDKSDLVRFARLTERHETLGGADLARLEPALAGRFTAGLYYSHEAHMAAPDALIFLYEAAKKAGVEFFLGGEPSREVVIGSHTIDCRGIAARELLPELRGVRGERILIRSHDVSLSRPVRLLHPRQSIYVVPWGNGRFMVGATAIESENAGGASVRSALELLGALYALHPAFAEAEIIDIAAGLRPAFPDNIPRAIVRDGGRKILVNGAWRHGFLIAPMLADAVARYLANGETSHPLLRVET